MKPPEQSACSSQASQGLVRSLSDPHSPVWLSGQHYPAQYLIRQTRSMSKAQGHQAGSLIKLKPPLNMTLPVREFDLPDDMFFHLKQERMLRSSHNHSSCIQCELVDGLESTVGLRCTEVIPCHGGKVPYLFYCEDIHLSNALSSAMCLPSRLSGWTKWNVDNVLQ